MPLSRTLEPEIMCSEHDALAYGAIDHTRSCAAFVELLASELGFQGGRLLDLGAGPGDLAVEICRRFAGAEVTALDLSPAMTGLAEEKIKRAGFSGRVLLLRADAKATELPGGSFDFVISNNLIHHIPEPGAVFSEIARLCRPGAGSF